MPRKQIDFKDTLNELSQKAKSLENKTILNDFGGSAEVKPKRKLKAETSFPNEKIARKKNEIGFQIQNSSSYVPKKHYSEYQYKTIGVASTNFQCQV